MDKYNKNWDRNLLSTEDKDFILLNMERRIREFPFEKKFWHSYIKYLEAQNSQVG